MYKDREPYVDHIFKRNKKWLLLTDRTEYPNVIDVHFGARSLNNGRADVWRGHMKWRDTFHIVHFAIKVGNLIHVNFGREYGFKLS